MKDLLPAAQAVAQFQGGFDDAVAISLLVLLKGAAASNSKPNTLWPSLRKGSGAANRIFKRVDSSLALVILQHWLSVVKRGAELEWDPLFTLDRITTLWNALLVQFPPTPARQKGSKHGMPHLLLAGQPHILKVSRQILHHALSRRVAVIKAIGVAGHILPPELINKVSDELCDSKVLLLASRTFKHFAKQGVTLVAVRAWRLNPKNNDPKDKSKDPWSLTVRLHD